MNVICRECGRKTHINAPALNLKTYPKFNIELEGKRFYSQCWNCKQMQLIELGRWESEGGR
jgi:hypothetical protein